MRVSGLTDKGIKRNNNEDYYLISDHAKVFVVADGMGGYKAGEIASEIASKAIIGNIEDRILSGTFDFGYDIEEILMYASNEILAYVENNPDCKGMGTTVVVAHLKDNILYIANVGDSRCYAITENNVTQLTKDHSLVAELVKIGSISAEEAEMHPDKNIITSALGVDSKFEIYKSSYDINDYKYILICSDGLSNMVTTDEILSIFKNHDFDEVSELLVQSANQNGGKDNITVVCIEL
ncbi:MAG: Stp1/IreP family PP2C-type Ser/Thr phosphatase [Bacillota bacterium]|nr:Stp1/IreP family PP2C-type Ser/Thr phosphatase [Bacillota bacterium]